MVEIGNENEPIAVSIFLRLVSMIELGCGGLMVRADSFYICMHEFDFDDRKACLLIRCILVCCPVLQVHTDPSHHEWSPGCRELSLTASSSHSPAPRWSPRSQSTPGSTRLPCRPESRKRRPQRQCSTPCLRWSGGER